MQLIVLTILAVLHEAFVQQIVKIKSKKVLSNEIKRNEFDEQGLVTDGKLFPFMAAILVKSKFLSAGALIDNSWVLTAADSLYLLRESRRTIRVRLGSNNYRKGGTVFPVKDIAIHPNFDDVKPSCDLAMVRLPEPVRYTPTLKAIRLQRIMKEADATHFIVPSWTDPMTYSDEADHLKSMEVVNHRRLLSVTHLHPINSDDCEEDLAAIGVNNKLNMMCLDTGVMIDPCSRDIGAPVVLNGFLWGIVSSWRPNNCDTRLAGSLFVTRVSAPNISTWIHATMDGHEWARSIEK